MCTQAKYDYSYPAILQTGVKMKKYLRFPGVSLIFIFILQVMTLSAQVANEDFLAVKNWKMPNNAVEAKTISLVDDVHMKGNIAFTGWAVEHYPNGSLLRATQYLDGLQHGLMLLWYPDGSPQMSANYLRGVLHGRFLGWYMNGGIIYDMVINKGTYAGDNLADGDDGRERSDMEDTEREGSTNDSTPE